MASTEESGDRMADGLIEAVRGLRLAHPELGPNSLLAKLREQQPGLEAGNMEVREALAALKAEESKAPALSNLSDDSQLIIFNRLRNVLDPGPAVAFASITPEVWALMQPLVKELRDEHEEIHEEATVLWLKAKMENCKVLREAEEVEWNRTGLTSRNLESLGKLGSELPALKKLTLCEPAAGHDGVSRLAEELVAGAWPAMTKLDLSDTYVGYAGSLAFAAALERGALKQLKHLILYSVDMGDAALVALAPALRRHPALENLDLWSNPLGDEGLAALVAPPPPSAGAPTTSTTGVLTKLKDLNLNMTKVTDEGCATLASALSDSALPALEMLFLSQIPASAAATAGLGRAGLFVMR